MFMKSLRKRSKRHVKNIFISLSDSIHFLYLCLFNAILKSLVLIDCMSARVITAILLIHEHPQGIEIRFTLRIRSRFRMLYKHI